MPCSSLYTKAMMSSTDHAMRYTITIEGHLDAGWQEWFDDLSLMPTEDGNTQLCGVITDQAALYGILRRINNLGIHLISVNPTCGT